LRRSWISNASAMSRSSTPMRRGSTKPAWAFTFRCCVAGASGGSD